MKKKIVIDQLKGYERKYIDSRPGCCFFLYVIFRQKISIKKEVFRLKIQLP
jgi:hypothetical protein